MEKHMLHSKPFLSLDVSLGHPMGKPELSTQFRILAAIQNTSHVFRYNLQPVLFRQNIAEHMGRCCMIAAVTASELCLSSQETSELMLKVSTHDLHESFIGDVLFPTKNDKRVKDGFDHMDSEVECRLFMSPEFTDGEDNTYLPLLDAIHCSEAMTEDLTKIIDLSELLLYATHESQMGNRHFDYMVDQVVKGLSGALLDFKNNSGHDLRGPDTTIGCIFRSAQATIGGYLHDCTC
jgi:5'-deoxynucleotidase YfbR-like HD superfamily hydrolase